MKEFFLFFGYTKYLDKENPFAFVDINETNTEKSLLDLCDGYLKSNKENLKLMMKEDLTRTEYICKHDFPGKGVNFVDGDTFIQCSIKD